MVDALATDRGAPMPSGPRCGVDRSGRLCIIRRFIRVTDARGLSPPPRVVDPEANTIRSLAVNEAHDRFLSDLQLHRG